MCLYQNNFTAFRRQGNHLYPQLVNRMSKSFLTKIFFLPTPQIGFHVRFFKDDLMIRIGLTSAFSWNFGMIHFAFYSLLRESGIEQVFHY